MTNVLLPVIFLCLNFLLGCPPSAPAAEKPSVYSAPGDTFPYRIHDPSLTINFPDPELKEISGISATNVPGVLVGIQDETGIIYFIDAANGGKILNKVVFEDKGDFEGVENVGSEIYVVKSSGKIFEVGNLKKKDKPSVIEYDTPLEKEHDVEGLGYDPKRNALLLACKGNPDLPEKRLVYAFDLATKKLVENPVYTIDPVEIDRLLPSESEESKRFFASSGIAVHPINGDVYVMSSVRKRLAVLDYSTGAIKYAVQLDKKILPQPEGISFDKNGNLFISSEGKNGEGLLLEFIYQTKTSN